MKATDKQVKYIFFLLKEKGYSVSWMNADFKKLGATMRERSGRVEEWVRNMNVAEASELIEKLKK